MSSQESSNPLGLVDARELAKRLGVSPATIRSWRKRGESWLPDPVAKFEGLVWLEEDVQQIVKALKEKGKAGAKTMVDERNRAKGAYYTPAKAAQFLASWVVRNDGETYLEPSFGDGVFIKAVRKVSQEKSFSEPNWIAHELDIQAATFAVENGLIRSQEVITGDFLSQPISGLADAVIANPPFVRLRNLVADQRDSALASVLDYSGIEMLTSGSVWMPFLSKMTASLKNGGRLAVVLPLDFTYVAYARQMWKFLGDSFGEIVVNRIHERLFPDINQDVMLLLADNYGGACTDLQFNAFETVDALQSADPVVKSRIAIADILQGERVFQTALLNPKLQALIKDNFGGLCEPAGDHADFRIGYVSGDKEYFHPSFETIIEHSIPATSLHRTLTNSRKLRGKGLLTSEINEGVADLLWLPSTPLSKGEKSYIISGEKLRVNMGYKCSRRSPWYLVPGVKAPDLIVTVFSENPLLVVNDAGWFVSNSLLSVFLKSKSTHQFVQNWYTPLTLLSIGLQVHSLGGGVMVMVPNEAASIRIPMLDSDKSSLDRIKTHLAKGDTFRAYGSSDEQVKRVIGEDNLALVYEGIDVLNFWRTR